MQPTPIRRVALPVKTALLVTPKVDNLFEHCIVSIFELMVGTGQTDGQMDGV